MIYRHLYLFLALLSLSVPFSYLYALDTPSEMLPNPAQEKEAENIGSQLRCLVCQNESIEDSSATLARDLRHVVREHVQKGEQPQQIMDWMVQRYGEFIRLRPTLTPLTFLLWAMPITALIIGCVLSIGFYRQNKNRRQQPLSKEEQDHLQKMLERSSQK